MHHTTRLFIAAPVPEELKSYLSRQASSFQHEAIRMVPEVNLHLTLFFIGNVPIEQLSDIREVTAHMAGQFAPFDLKLQAVEPGPKPRSPRLVWARFAPDDTFANLSRGLAQALSPQPLSQRDPIPHITLARFRKDRPTPHNLEAISPTERIVLSVREIAVWHSELASPHPRYTILHRYPLTGNPQAADTV
ncbi:RNA 2',3'-cyclic phosphodiesterase [uncultured Pontibacter sp.]|uniref:RNA 2',3'-cyclic phosphodiesterase n=1 Tax=uncultured Pontibacter sp. TaxID=453356 RepID=UPI00261EF6C7|nr:RNA 2',3'-cyclic phosphodiesterase [uncultured Pontibacter sp.]